MMTSQPLSRHADLDRGGKAQPLLRVRDLKKHFILARGGFGRQASRVHAVDGVDFDVFKGETLGIVGESGCGKSTTARLLMHLLAADGGEMVFDGDAIGRRGGISVREMRRQVQMVFQNSYASLNPRMSVEDSIAFGPQVHGVTRRESRQRARRLLDQVGLSASLFAHRYPHELSGGQRQRVNIARALALEPRLLILDEAVSALDKSVEAQVLNLLMDLKQEYGLTYLFISHDLNVVRYISDRVMVMYLGKVAEMGEVEALYRAPAHPYTRALLSAMPSMQPDQRTQQAPLVGDPPNPIDLPPGCRFCPRCPMAIDACRAEEPALELCAPAHQVACLRADEVMAGAVPVTRVSEESPT
ncbi:oligopeptide/dipeptide ABC transporter ATP-binding protein [Franzmannia qiaohouensis]|uniref:Glutathione import ATP-binding protein GsiA n=1 Tax=Franzmannia qiaohouensis TaxID=1329370 RepID=A0ABU1H8R7_9GAMM|nr:oligopeptide/dipeptide ABC transporter ATP-binding protein [Halomonas qiaohouensis]MDR5903845.1 ATP-binding cassette domain-containing protein [Halomonas qiaohouensis]